EWKYKEFSITAGGTYSGRYNIASETNSSIQTYAYSPEYRVNAGYKIPKILVSVNAFYKYNGALPGYLLGANNEVIQTQIDAYQLMDFTAGRSFLNQKFQVTCGVKNLFNVTNINNSGAGAMVHGSGSSMPVSWGRSFFVQMTFNLQEI
uniref:hypothetical protein n=1 Tax=Umezakia ovalisporum TaxID=75695 RepID=UPI0039C6F69D